jgi:hypothetical protein
VHAPASRKGTKTPRGGTAGRPGTARKTASRKIAWRLPRRAKGGAGATERASAASK